MLSIRNIPVTPLQQNCRFIFDAEEDGGIVIDPGGEVERILEQVRKDHRTVSEIWLTHSHFDHCGGVRRLKEETQAPLVAHPDEEIFRQNVEQACRMYAIPASDMADCPEPDKTISGGEILSCGSHQFKVLFTPGHAPGHLCFYCEEQGVLIAGDTLFAGSIGRSDLPGGDHARLLRSIREEILSLPDGTAVLPGHGPDTTVGSERGSNPFLIGG